MLERRALRFAVEVLILVAVAAAVTVAHLRSLVIAGLMLFAWVVVSVLEWAMLQGESHFESGLPPRYYVPQLRLPPRRYLDEGYPAAPAPADELAWLEAPPQPEGGPVAAPFEEELAPEPVAFVPEPEVAEPLALLPSEPEPEPEVVMTPELEWEPLVWESQPEEPVPASWFDAQLPGLSGVPELDADLAERLYDEELQALEAEPTASKPEVAAEPSSEGPQPEVEPELEPVAENLRREDADLARWFVGGAQAEEPEAQPRSRSLLDRVLGRLGVRQEEPEHVLEQELEWESGEEPQPQERAISSWFDAQLPGVARVSEPDAGRVERLVEEELQALEAEWTALEPEPEVAAEEPRPEEPEPVREEEPEYDVEFDYKLLGEQLRLEQPASATWFDSELPGPAPASEPDAGHLEQLIEEELQALEAEGVRELPEPEPVPELAPEEPVVEAWPARESLEPEPAFEELDYKLLAGQLEPDEPSLASWFDAQLPGAAFSSQELPAELDEGLVTPGEAGREPSGSAGVVAEPAERRVDPWEDDSGPEAGARTATHRIDPTQDAARKHFWQRHHDEERGIVEAPARPIGRRLLPGRSRRDN